MRTEEMAEDNWQNAVTAFINRGPGIILRLRGLPYECSAKEVVEFFRRGEPSAQVFDGENGVYFIKKFDGKSTGDALAQFGSEEELTLAMNKHKELIGNRYIELFRTPPAEVLQVVRRTLEVKNKPQGQRQQPGAHLTQTNVPCGPVRDCIRLRGLPFEVQVYHLLNFLGSYAKHIVFQGVHMVYNHLGHPTGEAFIQMQSESAAGFAAANCNNGCVTVGKKSRHVEVFQCSGEEMSAFLSGMPALPTPGINDSLPPQFLSVFPPVMDPMCTMAGHPLGNGRTFMYVVVNANEHFIPFQPSNDDLQWIAEFPPSPILDQPPIPQQQNGQIISLREI